jgi:hypothetical protein
MRPFKGIFCDDISEFESYMPGQAVRSTTQLREDRSKPRGTATFRRDGSVSACGTAMEAPFRPPVSDGLFGVSFLMRQPVALGKTPSAR